MDSQQAKNRLMAECSRKEISAHQARQWLMKHEIPESETKQIVNTLVKDKYIDDSRFAKAYTRDKLRFSKWGPDKILQGLSDAGIDKSIAQQAIKEEESLSLQILGDLLSRKQKELEKKQEKKIAETKKQIELLKEKLRTLESRSGGFDPKVQKERAALQRKIYALQAKIRTSNQQIRSALLAFAVRKGFPLTQISAALRNLTRENDYSFLFCFP
ncbi:MAG: RecX family transcriptional regulator [Bacteroidales bacterium]|nr:RecX family transcriptional regulator [Bacteroidales bacterium]